MFTFEEYLQVNFEILQSDLEKEDFVFVTCVREPMSLFLSWYYYFFYPKHHKQVSLEHFLGAYVSDELEVTVNEPTFLQQRMNQYVKELSSIWSLSNQLLLPNHTLRHWFDNVSIAQEYIDKYVDNDDLRFVYIVLERFDESLIVLKHILDCEYIDLVYLKMHASNEQLRGFYRFDGLFVPKTPAIQLLDPLVQRKIRALQGKSSFLLYDAAVQRLDRQLKYLQLYRNVNVTQELVTFRCVQNALSHLCNQVHANLMCIELCEQMAVIDIEQYFAFVHSSTFPIVAPFHSWYRSQRNNRTRCSKWNFQKLRRQRSNTSRNFTTVPGSHRSASFLSPKPNKHLFPLDHPFQQNKHSKAAYL
ncbi:galactose-3-O-sulfotransferase [Reticulomyxa filosa]|uniref:Galactose-3-O-sulfotransferase n=1 Tax=Reticulomyxa filosa TaxID=46433 RepID=X6NL27_RETFI|nr:galactose-3-O-sulfotransferase [Reticulomyxa filosa]|eukprot:ETO26092.1 galactose-3-O-sulfotransferase [Reticulomyxa filosa]